MVVNLESSASSSSSSASALSMQPSRKRSRSNHPGSGHPKKRTSPTQSYSIGSTKSSGSIELPIPFTRTFFEDMAAVILLGFPIRDFARKHRCRRGDVSDALRAVVTEPLCKSTPVYHQSIIKEWCTGHDEIAHSTPGVSGQMKNSIVIASTSCSSTSGETSALSESIVISDELSCGSSEGNSEGAAIAMQPEVVCISGSDETCSNKAISVGPKISTTAQTRRWSGMPPTERVKVFVDLWGSYIPANKWIDGWHRIRPVPSDAMSDDDFEEWLNRRRGENEDHDWYSELVGKRSRIHYEWPPSVAS